MIEIQLITTVVKNFYDLITNAVDRNKDDKANQVKIQQIRRHFDEWLSDRTQEYKKQKMQKDLELHRLGLRQSGKRIEEQKYIDDRLKKDVERNIADMEDEIKLIELGNK